MAIRSIAKMGHPVLRGVAERVEDPTDPNIARLAADMRNTLEHIGCAYQKPYPKLHIHEICRFVGGGGDYRKDFSELSLKFVPDIADPSRIGGACSEPECELEQRTVNCIGGAAFPESSGDASILVMKTANVREGDDLSSLQLIDAARLRALLVQREMRSCGVVVSKVGT